MLTLLEELIDAIEDEIDDGTRCFTRYDHSPESVSADTSWQETSYSPEAERLINVFVVLDEFYVLLFAPLCHAASREDAEGLPRGIITHTAHARA